MDDVVLMVIFLEKKTYPQDTYGAQEVEPSVWSLVMSETNGSV